MGTGRSLTIAEGVLQEAGTRSVQELAQEENELLVKLIRMRAQAKELEAKTHAA